MPTAWFNASIPPLKLPSWASAMALEYSWAAFLLTLFGLYWALVPIADSRDNNRSRIPWFFILEHLGSTINNLNESYHNLFFRGCRCVAPMGHGYTYAAEGKT